MSNKYQQFDSKYLFISPFEYFYFRKPNALRGQLNLSKVFNESSSSYINENQSSCGVEFSQRKQKKSVFIENLMYLMKPYELLIKYKYGKGENDIKRKSTVFSNKLKLSYNFLKERVPVTNRDFLPLDPLSKMSFQIAHKTVNNVIENFSVSTCPNEIVTNLPEQDSQLITKVSYENNKLPHNTLYNEYFKISTSFIKSLNSFYMKNSMFYRKIIPIAKNILTQFNFEGANLFNISKNPNTALKVHEKLYMYSCKGIMNPSKKISVQSTNSNKQNYDYMIGNTSYTLQGMKVFFKNCPLLYLNTFSLEKEGFEILPFCHCSALLTNGFDYIRLSSGLGVSVISKLFAFEILFTPYIKKEASDIHSKFQVKFGID